MRRRWKEVNRKVARWEVRDIVKLPILILPREDWCGEQLLVNRIVLAVINLFWRQQCQYMIGGVVSVFKNFVNLLKWRRSLQSICIILVAVVVEWFESIDGASLKRQMNCKCCHHIEARFNDCLLQLNSLSIVIPTYLNSLTPLTGKLLLVHLI